MKGRAVSGAVFCTANGGYEQKSAERILDGRASLRMRARH